MAGAAARHCGGAGVGIIPWQFDVDALAEDWFLLLAAPPVPQLRTLSRAYPFDLHALLPVPDAILRLGPDHPEALAWLWQHWGTTEALRHVAERARMLAAADWLERRLQLGRDVFPRGAVKNAPAGRDGDLTELLRGCLVALRLPVWVEFYRPRWPAFWQVTDAILRITQLLNDCAEGDEFARFLPEIAAGVPARDLQCRAAVASTLVAGRNCRAGERSRSTRRSPGPASGCDQRPTRSYQVVQGARPLAAGINGLQTPPIHVHPRGWRAVGWAGLSAGEQRVAVHVLNRTVDLGRSISDGIA